nr:hypothetical protein [Comamonas testosteroni]
MFLQQQGCIAAHFWRNFSRSGSEPYRIWSFQCTADTASGQRLVRTIFWALGTAKLHLLRQASFLDPWPNSKHFANALLLLKTVAASTATCPCGSVPINQRLPANTGSPASFLLCAKARQSICMPGKMAAKTLSTTLPPHAGSAMPLGIKAARTMHLARSNTKPKFNAALRKENGIRL